MSQHNNSSGAWRDDLGREFNESTIKIRDTILNCKVEGLQTTAKSVVKIELHLASIAQSLVTIAESLSTIERLKMIE